MRRSPMVLSIPLLAVSLLGGGTPASAADQSCPADHVVWPRKVDAEGTAFTGRPVNTWVNQQGMRVFLFDVLKVKVGSTLPEQVRVRLRCVETPFRIGARYLITSSNGFRRDGRFYFEFSDRDAAAWRLRPDDHVRLLGYGKGTEWENVPRYLDRPETLRQAVIAVTPDNIDQPAVR